MSFFNGYSEFEYYKSPNKCYHLVDVDFDSDHKYRVMWKGTPTPLGELFNKKVKEYTSLDVVLSFFEIQTDAYLDFVLQIENDVYGSLHSNYEIASYRDDSGDLPTVYFGDITAAIMKAFLESVEELKLPPIEDKLKSIRRINVRITNADQNITSKKSDKERKKYLKKGYNGLTNEELEPYKLSLVPKTLIFSEIDLESKLTPLGKAFNEKLKERTDMDIAFAEIYSANNQGIHLYL